MDSSLKSPSAVRTDPARPTPPGTASRRHSRRRLLTGWWVAAAAVVAALGTLYGLMSRTAPLEVRVVRLRKGVVEDTVSSTKAGSVRSRAAANLSVDAAGAIVAIHAREGERVRKGDHLISIDPRDAQVVLKAAERALTVLEAQRTEATARHDDAVRELRRAEDLRKTGTLAQLELDQATTRADVAAAALEAARARAEAQQVEIERSRLAVQKCAIHAPFDGVVAELLVEVGEWATPGLLAVRLIDPDRLYVRAELDEVDLAPLKTGLPVRLSLDPYRDRKFRGRVVRVAPYVSELQEQNRTVEVEVELLEHAGGEPFKPGTSADVEVILKQVDGVLRVPTAAVIEGRRVLVAGADGRARAVAVRTGLRNWEFTEIQEGLAEGDAVIVSLESDKLRDGAAIRIVREEGSP